MNKGELDKSGGAQMRVSCVAQMVRNGRFLNGLRMSFKMHLGHTHLSLFRNAN